MIKPLIRLSGFAASVVLLLSLSLLPGSNGSGMVWPVEPLRLSVSEFGSTSAFTLSIRIETETPANNYIRISLANYTTINPKACYFGLYGSQLSQTACNSISGAAELFILNPVALRTTESYSLLVQLQDTNPLKMMSGIIQIQTVSAVSLTDFIIYDYNRNFGQAAWIQSSGSQGTSLTTSFLNFTNEAVKNQPGALIGFSFRIFINKPVIAAETRLKMILTAPFSFNDKATAVVENDPRYAINGESIYKAPAILRVSIDSPLELSVRFSENLVENKAFIITFANIQNPSLLASSLVKLYTMVGNGETFIEKNENALTLQTLTKPLKVELALASGAPLVLPAGFYKDQSQFIEIRINTPIDIPPNDYLKINFGAGNTAIKGTASISENVKPFDSSLPIKFDYNSNILLISNIDGISNSNTIVVILRVRFDRQNPTFVTTVTIDASSVVLNALFSGSSPTYNTITSTDSMATGVGGGGSAKTSAFTLAAGGGQTFQLNINPVQSNNGATLKLILPKQVRKTGLFNPVQNCKIAGAAFPNCVLEESAKYTYVEMKSPTDTNLVGIGVKAVNIENVVYSVSASDLADNIWEVYGVLESDQSASPSKSYFMVTIWVNVPATGVTAGSIQHTVINNEYLSTLNVFIPNFLTLIGTSSNAVSYSVGANERRVLTYFLKQGFKSLSSSQASQADYPCSSTFQSVTCTYIEGDTGVFLNDFHPLYWDRIHIYPSSDFVGNEWRVMLPYYFTNAGPLNYYYAFGVENTVTRRIRYPYYLNGNTITPAPRVAASLESNFEPAMSISFSGYSGTFNRNVPFTIVCKGTRNGIVGNDYASAVVVSSPWQMWSNSLGEVNDVGTPALVASGSKSKAVLSIAWFDSNAGRTLYFTVIPITSILINVQSTIKLALFFPYGLDVPNYRVFYSDNKGALQSWNTIQNSGYNAFSGNTLQTLSIDCDYKYDDFLNSYCQILFKTVSRVEPQAKIHAVFTGFIFKEAGCQLSYKATSDATTSTPLNSVTCAASGASSSTLIASLNEANFSPEGYIYNLTVKGLDIGSSSIRKTLNLQVRDKTGGYILEQDTITITTFGQLQGNFISVNSIAYGYNNPSSYSSLNITFLLPRNMKDTEQFEINLSEDINDVNPDMGSLQYLLFDPQYKKVLVYMQFSSSSTNILVNFNNPDDFKAGQYILVIRGIRLPAGNSNSQPRFYLRRKKDSNIVLENLLSATAKFPEFNNIPLLNVALRQTRYNLEGHPMELTFDITTSQTVVNGNSLLLIRFPYYFNLALANIVEDIACKVEGIIVGCAPSKSAPLQLEVFDFPLVIRRGQTFSLVVFGILTPRSINRYDPKAGRETVFLGLDSNRNGTLSESLHIQPPPVKVVGDSLAYTFLDDVQLESLRIKKLTKHTLYLRSQIKIPKSGGLLVTFASVYNSLMYLSEIDCSLSYVLANAATDLGAMKCQVAGKVVRVTLSSEIPAGASITWVLLGVPTPNEPASVAMNSLLISVFDTDGASIIARSFSGLNKASSVQFQIGQFSLNINNNKDILITRGTFSNVINISPKDGGRFVNNILVNSTSRGIFFEPSSFTVLIGDQSTSFRVGIDKDVKDGLYPLVFSKKETGFTSVYGSALEIFVYVVSRPIVIAVPPTIDVRRRACSSPALISLFAAPNSDITIRVRVNENVEHLSMDPLLSSYALWFDKNNPTNQLVVCVADTLPLNVGTLFIDLSITGTNAKSYILDRSRVQINVLEADQPEPQLSLEVWQIGRTRITYKLRTNTEGFMYWRLIEQKRFQELGAPFNTFENYKLIMKNNNFTELTVFNDFGEKIEVFSYLPVFTFSLVNGTRFLTIDKLRPETQYNLYAFMTDTYGVSIKNFSQSVFTTDRIRNLTKVAVQFSRVIFSDQFNSFLCFITRRLQTNVKYVISASGLGCSFNIDPTSYYFQYKGRTFSTDEKSTNIYIVPEFESDDQESALRIRRLFQDNKPSALADSFSEANVLGLDFISKIERTEEFTYSTLRNHIGKYAIPSVGNFSYRYDLTTYNTTLVLSNVTLSSPGVVYFVLYEDTEINLNGTASQDVSQRDYRVPSAQQVLNCQGATNELEPNCARAVFDGDAVNVTFWSNIKQNMVYKLFYVITNESPMEPIFENKVNTYNVNSYVYSLDSRLIQASLTVMTFALGFFLLIWA